jgi:hypothetical protein
MAKKAKNLEPDKHICSFCGWKGLWDQVLRGSNPFVKNHLLSGCPRCLEIDTVVRVCDEPGCWELQKWFIMTDTGGRRTCDKHRPVG